MSSIINSKKNSDEESPVNIIQVVRTYRKLCKSARKRVIKKLDKQRNECDEASNWLWSKQIGDSLLTAAVKVPKGVSEWILLNVHTQKEEKIRLNPKLNASRNAEIFYRKARKGKRSVEICRNQIKESEQALLYIETLINECNGCLHLDENSDEFSNAFERLQKNLQKNKALGALPINKASKEDSTKVPYRHFTIDGWDVYIGKSNSQNDELSTKFAKPWDIWFHVAAHTGSHIVVRRRKNSEWPSRPLIEKVAALSVWFSKARYTSYAEVNVCEARYVSKPRKAPPGEVVIKHYKTVRVSPKAPKELFSDE